MDNAAPHSSAYCWHQFVSLDVQMIFNCPNSPALNPIELIFSDLKQYVRDKNR